MIRISAPILLLSLGCTSVTTVRDGVLYRSGQLSPSELESEVKAKGIRTVVNLRGEDRDAKWYGIQRKLLDRLDVEQIDLKLDGESPNERTAEVLLDIYRNEPKPILVQSKWSSGSARLASGVYRAGIEHNSSDEARKELALWQTKWLPFLPGAQHDEFLAEWRPGPSESRRSTPAKRAIPEDLFDPGPTSRSRDFEVARSDEPRVILGPPRPLTESQLADSDRDNGLRW